MTLHLKARFQMIASIVLFDILCQFISKVHGLIIGLQFRVDHPCTANNGLAFCDVPANKRKVMGIPPSVGRKGGTDLSFYYVDYAPACITNG